MSDNDCRFTVALAGSLDTKAGEFAFARDLVKSQGVRPLLIDFGVLAEPVVEPDIRATEIARAGGAELEALRASRDKTEAMRAMSAGLAAVVKDLASEGRIHGILGMGGTGGTAIASAAMRGLPVGFPKVLVSTVGSGDVSPYVGAKDVTMMHSVVDVAGLNRISRQIFSNAVAAVCGMVKAGKVSSASDRPVVAASMFGNTTPCIDRARAALDARGLEVLVFHATGTGGRTMQALAGEGQLDALLDLTTTELADEVCGGVFSAGVERTEIGARAAIPAVLAPGCVDMCNFWGPATVPERYRDRQLYEWNSNVTLLRTNREENVRIGELLAETANSCAGPVVVLIPLGGVSMLDSPGGAFWNPEAGRACFDALRRGLRPGIRTIEMDSNINDPAFADRAVEELCNMRRAGFSSRGT
jgi:uncharacterized protein (UPF0261 family)